MSMTMHVRLTVWQLIEARPARRAAAVRRRCDQPVSLPLPAPPLPPLPIFRAAARMENACRQRFRHNFLLAYLLAQWSVLHLRLPPPSPPFLIVLHTLIVLLSEGRRRGSASFPFSKSALRGTISRARLQGVCMATMFPYYLGLLMQCRRRLASPRTRSWPVRLHPR